jgi:hypothetical protein
MHQRARERDIVAAAMSNAGDYGRAPAPAARSLLRDDNGVCTVCRAQRDWKCDEVAHRQAEEARLRAAGAVCTTCGDTHIMWMSSQEQHVPCTACPRPCPACVDGRGAYCKTPRCACACHAPPTAVKVAAAQPSIIDRLAPKRDHREEGLMFLRFEGLPDTVDFATENALPGADLVPPDHVHDGVSSVIARVADAVADRVIRNTLRPGARRRQWIARARAKAAQR